MRRFMAGGGLVLAFAAWLQVAPVMAQARPDDRRTIDYVVREGDTLIGLAETGFIRPSDYRQVQDLNHVVDPRRMPIGLVLTIPANLLRSGPASARLVGFRGDVVISERNATRRATMGAVVPEGVTVTTGANAFARFSFPDGTHVTAPSQSRIRFTRLRSYVLNNAMDSEITVETGRAESQVAPVRTPGDFRIRTPLSVTAVRGTDFRVSYDPQIRQSSTEVLHGVVGVFANQSETAATVNASQAIVTDAAGSRRVDLLEPPRLANPEAIQTGVAPRFTVVPIAGSARYRATLSQDAEVHDSLQETLSEPGTERLMFAPVEDGTYFVRLTALSSAGAEGLPAIYQFEWRRSQITDMRAVALDSLRFLFQWRTRDGNPAEFGFELRRLDGPGAGIVQTITSLSPEIVVPISDPGLYEWRVGSARQINGKAVQIWSEPLSLRIGH